MLKKSKPVVWILICFLAIAMVSLACNLPRGDGRKLVLDERDEDGSVSGQYQGTEGQVIEFEVTTDGYATFRADEASVEESVTVLLSDPGFANMTWGGTTIDGQGVLEEEEQVAFENLMNSELANGMAMIPLDIACLGEDAIDPKQLAALVFPLQMYFKYQVSDRGAEAERLMDLSACDYRNLTENTLQILFAPSIPIPVVFSYFPFDEKGAIEAPVSMNTGIKTACLDAAPIAPVGRSNAPNPGVRLGGPCGAMCRGACGSDCARSNCDYREEKRCEKDEAGKNTGLEVNYQIYDCGVHQACIEHDACYDACNETFGCGTWDAAYCRHADSDGCDQITIDYYGYKNGFAWAKGYGPQPMRETFEYEETWTKELNAYKCPSEAIINETPKIEIIIPNETPKIEFVIIPVGTYTGESTFYTTLDNDVDNSYLEPVCIENSVTVEIDSDGTALGGLSSICYANQDTDNEDMMTTHHSEVSGIITGELLDMSGQLTISYRWHSYFTSPQWETTSLDQTVDFEFLYNVSVSNDVMTFTPAGNVEDYYSFVLIKE